MTQPTLADAIAALGGIAPLRYAGSWDNVGLLVQGADLRAPLGRALLTIDLNRRVLEEALEHGAQLVIAYHPVIFKGHKRLTDAHPEQSVLLDLIRAGISVYSPHTALDAAPGGVCDWLIDGLGALASRAPVEEVRDLAPELAGTVGAGRVGELVEPVSLDVLVERLKVHLGLPQVRVAAAAAHADGAPIRRLAVCPGAGGSLFEKLRGPELFVTGEMRHHDVLARVARGESVILTDHTNTERGYLAVLAERLGAALAGADFVVSERDRDPLVIR